MSGGGHGAGPLEQVRVGAPTLPRTRHSRLCWARPAPSHELLLLPSIEHRHRKRNGTLVHDGGALKLLVRALTGCMMTKSLGLIQTAHHSWTTSEPLEVVAFSVAILQHELNGSRNHAGYPIIKSPCHGFVFLLKPRQRIISSSFLPPLCCAGLAPTMLGATESAGTVSFGDSANCSGERPGLNVGILPTGITVSDATQQHRKRQ